MSKEAHTMLLKSGMMWEIFPEFTGEYKRDLVILKTIKDSRNKWQ